MVATSAEPVMSTLISLHDSVLKDRTKVVEEFEGLAQSLDPRWSPDPNRIKELIPIVVSVLLDESHVLPDHLLPHSDFLGGSDISHDDVIQALTRSHIDISKLTSFDVDQLRGAMISARGALVENDVYEKLLTHRLPVPEGTSQIVQDSFNHPGSDFRFLDAKGHVIESMNVKAAKSLDSITQHFHAHPDVNVVFATHDAALAAKQHGFDVVSSTAHDFVTNGHQVVVDIGHTSSWYQDQFLRHSPGFGTFGHGHVLNDGFSHGSFLHHFPWISTSVIIYRAARRYRDGMELAEQKKLAGQDATRVGVSLTVGKVLHAAGLHFPGIAIGSIGSVIAVQGLYSVRESWSDLSESEDFIAEYAESFS
jgi:hypothetical protein